MVGPKKGGIGLLLLGGKPKAGDSEPPPPMDDDSASLAAQGLIDAIKNGDAQAVVEAFKTLCEATEPPESGS